MCGMIANMPDTGYISPSMEGRQIKAARALLGWSQTKLCEEAEISRATLNDIENETGDPRRSTTQRIEAAFNKNGLIFLSTGDTRDGGPGVRLRTN